MSSISDDDVTRPKVILFDFFGTLVTYSTSRTEQGYEDADAVLRANGCRVPHADWLATWAATSEELDRQADETGREFSMHDAFDAFIGACDVGPATADLADRFISAYATAWATAIGSIDGVPEMLDELRDSGCRLAVVSNTHSPALVPAELERAGIAEAFEAVITSIGVGHRKPHPAIYTSALDALGATAAECAFVGDSYRPDYVGPRAVGIDAFLIASAGAHDVPEDRRLDSVLSLVSRLC
jgi:putative hydrolase of the HAD superfamily